MAKIRTAQTGDWKALSALLDQLEYPGTGTFLEAKVERLIHQPDEHLLVYEEEGPPARIRAFISLHFIPQLGLEGDFARISYFAVDSEARSRGIGKEMEEYCSRLAQERGCDRIEVHCHERREGALAFYSRQGFKESPKYLIKKLI
jgi:ribosomal protein S18 acetylase RimI-like enzyme